MIKLTDQNGNLRDVMFHREIDGRSEFIGWKDDTPKTFSQILGWRIDERDRVDGEIVVTGPGKSTSHTVVYYPGSKGYVERFNMLNTRQRVD